MFFPMPPPAPTPTTRQIWRWAASGGIICGADKLSRVAWLQSGPAIAEVLGVEAVASQSTFSRFFARFKQNDCNLLNQLHRKAIHELPSHRDGYTLDMDSWSLLHEDGHQEGVRVGHTRQGNKPCHRAIVAGLAGVTTIAGYALRRGDSHCVKRATGFLGQTVSSLPRHIRVGLVQMCQLNTLRWRLFSWAGGWSRAQGKAPLKLAVKGEEYRNWFREIHRKLGAFPICNAVGSLLA